MKKRFLLSAVVLLAVVSLMAISYYAGSLQHPGPTGVTLSQISNSTGTFTAHELPDTGQTTVYTANDDGAYQPAASQPSYTMYCWNGSALVQTADVNVSSITVDNRTGLVWATDGALVAASTWTVAITNCQKLNTTNYGGTVGYAGYTDWRLPNVRELMSIVNYKVYSPSIDTTKFRNIVNDYYWSSTTNADSTTLAWIVGFDGGSVLNDSKTLTYSVRPVRGGP